MCIVQQHTQKRQPLNPLLVAYFHLVIFLGPSGTTPNHQSMGHLQTASPRGCHTIDPVHAGQSKPLLFVADRQRP
jgi:hypothetical protein